jgi:hypothetical protein
MMSTRDTMLQTADAMAECIQIMKGCTTPEEIRTGFLRVADIMSRVPGQDQLVSSMSMSAQPGSMNNEQLVTLRDKLIGEFNKGSDFLRKSAGELPDSTGGGKIEKSSCFIATAVFENPEAPEVVTLRVFRDGVLSKSIAGRLLVRAYYALSPGIARLISRSERLKKIARRILRPIVKYLRKR